MKRIRLACWDRKAGAARARALKDLGYDPDFQAVDAGKVLGLLRSETPAGVIIDLSRSPAQGRDLGVALRVRADTRHLPLIFAGGDPEKVADVRRLLPDAEYTSWDGIAGALERALSRPVRDPVVPRSLMAGYSGTPLPRKLGVKPGARVLLAGAPQGFVETLGELPEGVSILRRWGSSSVDLILWFVRSQRELEEGIGLWAGRVGAGGMWILWPKKTSPEATDLTQANVRAVGLGAGLVDYKIAAVDATWSGLKFAVRKGNV